MLLARVLARLLGEGQLTIIDDAGKPHRIGGMRPGPAPTVLLHYPWTGTQPAPAPRRPPRCDYMADGPERDWRCGRGWRWAKPTWTASSPSKTATSTTCSIWSAAT